MTKQNRKTLNGVNGTANSSSRVALGGSVSQQHRHPVTACNIRKKTRIATWNVRTMNQPGKLECITREASRLKLDVLGLSEVRWKNSGKCTTDEYVMIYSGHKTEHKHGVGVLLSKQVAKSVMGFHALSDRILIVKISSKPFNLMIVQVYTPTSTSPEDKIEKFYDDLDAAYKMCGSQEMKIIMGDLIAKVGTEQDPLREVVGRYELGSRNERGDMWVDWCMTHDQVIMNTWFQHHKRHLYTWKSPGDGVRNQIDYTTINKRFRNSIPQVKGYSGVWSTLLYGSEAWTLSSKMLNKLEATEMWFLRRMQRISYTEHVTNVEVLRRSNTKRKLLSEMLNRQVKFFGHVMRKEEMENLVTTGYVEGKRARGRQRETYLTYL